MEAADASKRRIRRAFARYVEPLLLAQIEAKAGLLKLGGGEAADGLLARCHVAALAVDPRLVACYDAGLQRLEDFRLAGDEQATARDAIARRLNRAAPWPRRRGFAVLPLPPASRGS